MLQAYEFALEKVGVDFNSYQASSNYNRFYGTEFVETTTNLKYALYLLHIGIKKGLCVSFSQSFFDEHERLSS